MKVKIGSVSGLGYQGEIEISSLEQLFQIAKDRGELLIGYEQKYSQEEGKCIKTKPYVTVHDDYLY